VTITIVGEKGSLSFNPNPATVPAGQMVVWKNADTIVHRVVIDGVVDTGNIAPGATSAPQPLGDVSKAYHCSIHPTMVGSLNGAATSNPGNCDGYGC
jgi:plastocyanin